MIRDNFGEGLPDAEVTLSNTTAGFERTVYTTIDGVFEFSGLLPLPGYTVAVNRKGFADWKSNEFEVVIGQKLRITVGLQATAAAEGEAGVASGKIDQAGMGLATPITPAQIETLPLSGRRWMAAALQAPTTAPGGPYSPVAIAGQAYGNGFFIDGMDASQRFYRAAERQSRALAQDSVAEIAVMSGQSAEYGRSMAGAVGITTQTGYNDTHGSLYEYYRDPGLNADDPYALGRNLNQNRHQAGASIGGAWVPNRLFYFANAEVLDGRSDGMNRIVNPLITDPLGLSVSPSNCQATASQCAAAIDYIKQRMNVTVPRPIHSVAGLGKLEFRGSRQTLSLSADFMNWRARNGYRTETVVTDGSLLGNNADVTQRTRFAKAGWTAMMGDTASNEIRFGWWQDRFSEFAPGPPASTTGPSIYVAGAAVGASTEPNSRFKEQRYQLAETMAVTVGSQSIRFGVDYSKNEDYVSQFRNAAGTYAFPSLTAFALDLAGGNGKNYSMFTQTLGVGYREYITPEIGVFVHDTWRVLPRLTADFGLRWERPSLPQPAFANSDYWQTQKVNSPGINFAPRVALAYSLDQHTTLRFGWGWFYAPFSGELLDELYRGGQLNVGLTPNQTGSMVFPSVISAIKAIPNATKTLTFASGKLRNPIAKQTSLVLERSLTDKTTVSAAYLRSNGVKLWSLNDLNLAATDKTATYSILDEAGKTTGSYTTPYWTTRADPRYAHLYEIGNGAKSWYDALALQFRQRMWRGVTVQASYTWSHALDDAGPNGLIGVGIGNYFNNNPKNDKGASPMDQRRRATFNWSWRPQVGKGAPAVARAVVNGWEVSGMVTLGSGLPFTPTVITSGLQFSGLTPAYAGSLNGAGGWARVPFLDVGSLRAPAMRSVDGRLGRSFWFNERMKATVLMEAFNVFNAKYDTGVNTIAYVATGGALRPVPGLGAGNSAAAYPDGTNARRVQIGLKLSF